MRLDALICWRFDPFASLERGLDALQRGLSSQAHHPLWELLAESRIESLEDFREVIQSCGAESWGLAEAARQWNQRVSDSPALSYEPIAREVELRSRPLRDRWLGFAPGACRWLERALGEESTDPQSLHFFPILPHQGRGGALRAHGIPGVAYEALLYDVDPTRPEWLRWLHGATGLVLARRALARRETLAEASTSDDWDLVLNSVTPLADLLTAAAAAWVEAASFEPSAVQAWSRCEIRDLQPASSADTLASREAAAIQLFEQIDETALHRPESLSGWIDQQLRQAALQSAKPTS